MKDHGWEIISILGTIAIGGYVLQKLQRDNRTQGGEPIHPNTTFIERSLISQPPNMPQPENNGLQNPSGQSQFIDARAHLRF